MNRWIYLLIIFVLVLFFFSWPKSDNNAVAGCGSKRTQKVLFIGNSYTSFNNLPNLVKDIACSGGHKLEVTTFTPGGYKFSQHAKDKRVLELIASERWSFVILQNQSQVPGWKPAHVSAKSTPYAVALVRAIKSKNQKTKIIYFVTWGRENGDSQNCGYYSKVCTFEGNTQALLNGYSLYRNAAGGKLARVGSAWKAVVDDPDSPFDSGELWSGDHSHPELRGSYLAACTIFATIYNKSPSGLHYPTSLSSGDAAYLQRIAAKTMGMR
jgi:hypothetical protein